MLVLTRRTQQSILIASDIRVTVLSVRGNSVRLGIEAPGDVPIQREELVVAVPCSKGETDTIVAL